MKRKLSDPTKVIYQTLDPSYEFEFDGVGFVLLGEATTTTGKDVVFEATFTVDGKDPQTVKLSTNFTERRFNPFWKFGLEKGKHKVIVTLNNPSDLGKVRLDSLVVYDDKQTSVKY